MTAPQRATATDTRDEAPSLPAYRVDTSRGYPACGKCRRQVGNPDVWRCPYTTCRVWLRGLDDPAR